MIHAISDSSSSFQATLQLQEEFLSLLPAVQLHARVVFRALPAIHREEAIAESIASAYESFVGLRRRGKDPARDFPTRIADFAVKHTKDGRHVGGRSTTRDVLSAKAQARRGFAVQPLPMSFRTPHEEIYSGSRGQQRLDDVEEMLHDHRRSSPADHAGFKIDFDMFRKRLARRDRKLAEFLAAGNSGVEAAQRFRLSPGRITQIRQQLCRDWYAMHGEQPPRARCDGNPRQ